MIDEREKCKSCDVLFVEHVGVEGTCAKLQEAMRLLKEALLFLTQYGIDDDNIDGHIAKFLDEVAAP